MVIPSGLIVFLRAVRGIPGIKSFGEKNVTGNDGRQPAPETADGFWAASPDERPGQERMH
jgi:hypothetical protein